MILRRDLFAKPREKVSRIIVRAVFPTVFLPSHHLPDGFWLQESCRRRVDR